MTRNAYLPQVPVNFCSDSYCLRNVCKVSAHFIFLFIRHTNKGDIFCVWGLVLAASSRKSSNKTILCNSKLTPLHSTSLPVGAILNVIFLRAGITYHQESAGKMGMGSSFTFSQASLISFQEKKSLSS